MLGRGAFCVARINQRRCAAVASVARRRATGRVTRRRRLGRARTAHLSYGPAAIFGLIQILMNAIFYVAARAGAVMDGRAGTLF